MLTWFQQCTIACHTYCVESQFKAYFINHTSVQNLCETTVFVPRECSALIETTSALPTGRCRFDFGSSAPSVYVTVHLASNTRLTFTLTQCYVIISSRATVSVYRPPGGRQCVFSTLSLRAKSESFSSHSLASTVAAVLSDRYDW